MGNLVKFEFRKLFKSKPFLICLIISVAINVLNVTVNYVLMNLLDSYVYYSLECSLKDSLSNGSITLFCGIFTALFVCEDESYGTLKNIYSKGYKRCEVFSSKYVVALVGILIFIFTSFAISFIFGSVYFYGVELEPISNLFYMIFTQIIVAIGEFTIFFVISIKIGKVGGSIATNIAGPIFIQIGLLLVDSLANIENFKFSDYWISGFMMKAQTQVVTSSELTTCLIGAIIYIALFFFVGIKLNNKKEL